MSFSGQGGRRGRGLSFVSGHSRQNQGDFGSAHTINGGQSGSRFSGGSSFGGNARGPYRGGSGRGRGGYNDGRGSEADAMMSDGLGHRQNQSPGRSRGGSSFGESAGPNLAVEEVLVENIDHDTAPEGLGVWLSRKYQAQHGRSLNFVGSETRGNAIVFKMANALEAQAIMQLNGINFRAKKLAISQGQAHASLRAPVNNTGFAGARAPQSRPGGAIEAFRTILRNRYQPEQKYLDLSNMMQDPLLANERIRGFEPESKMGGVICKMIGECCPDVETLSLASNRLTTLSHFSILPTYAPNLTALSFQDNQLRSLRDIEPLRGSEFRQLRELLLSGNPIRDIALQKPGGDVVYRGDIQKLFPTIEILDMEPVGAEITFGVDTMAVELPLQSRTGFVDSPGTAALVNDFVQKFLTSFDANRIALFDLFHDQACFSLSLDSTGRSTKDPRGRDQLAFASWRDVDHNLEKVKSSEKRVSALARGGTNIIRAYERIPRTQHPQYPSPSYIVEGYQTGAGVDLTLFILLHGEFREVETNTNRSFDRTLVLVTPPPGSRSAAAGLPYSVSNDQLNIRAYAGNKAWASITETAPNGSSHSQPAHHHLPQLPDPTLLKQLQLQYQLDDVRQSQVIEFARATGLNYQFSLQCLSETGWSTPAAMQAYQNVKGNIPPEAYQVG
ncbi:uncharacterized protein EV422DRAFT_519926 [Fimicolochytrium jonesii]|uniref:uncharacterized protein n=1 Tax=Fimicolochytrium jonesii TaxID=1396493 RepID=UPI0022FE0BF8|nr:uncharacterized protein EV422DRAFT_519926 [Fimicolochytrium jonesii]KAI8824382.1 hypothetical protein EV422DRAFT_519926 [Fimicolochytrium jonesii]